MIIVRENLEDLYAGIEHMQTPDVGQTLKIISRKGSEKIIRYAFELARQQGRRKVTAATKANIMKLTEGLFKRTFEEIATEYPDIESEHLIIDNVAHQMAKNPAQFDVIVTTNLNGDIISDLASGLVGGLGFAPSGNYGDRVSIFEAVHGSAPKHAGKDVINPTALILSSIMMLRHIGETDAADRIEDAILVTLEEGKAATQDLVRQTGGDVEQAASTTGFTDTVIANLGRRPTTVPARQGTERPSGSPTPRPRWSYAPGDLRRDRAEDDRDRRLHRGGHHRRGARARDGGARGRPTSSSRWSRAAARWSIRPPGSAPTTCASGAAASSRRSTRTWTTRSSSRSSAASRRKHPLWTHIEKLHVFNGEPGFTKAQGQ